MRQSSESVQVLGGRVRKTIIALAETALPAGVHFPAAGEHTLAKVEQFLRDDAMMATGYVAMLRALDAAALVRHRRLFADLDDARRLAILESWRVGGWNRRNWLRALMAPLKMAHFDDPAIYKKLGCVYEFDKPRAEAKPAWFTERSHNGAALGGDLALECDVVVIGTGAGGAVVAKELAEAGVAVVLIEEGHYFGREDFNGRPFDLQRKMYRAGGATFAIGNTYIPIPIGVTVGGSTTVNSGTCYRAPDRVLREWVDDLGLDELSPEHLAPYYDKVEQMLGVAPARPEFLGGCARVIARGCDALGFTRHHPLRRNAPDCDGKGTCCFGCPTDAKRSMNVSYVPSALKAGAELFYGCRVERIVVEDGRATGIVARAKVSGHALTVHAKAVVVSCGSLVTPILLEKNGLCQGSGQLGANLSIHPAAGAIAEFDETISSWNAIPQGYAIEDLHEEGILFEGATTPLELTMALASYVGPRMTELAERYDHVASFGFMVEDTSRGRVRLVGGRPVITYVLNGKDVARMKRGVEVLARVFLAAGAKNVLVPIHGFREIRGEGDLDALRQADVTARDFEMSAYHPLGTARMGRAPSKSVVGPDHQTHEVAGLYIVDGSSVPTSLGVNPQITIMAMATRAATKIAEAVAG
ncbi:MAG TPA: GMC family oxidoreductase N-terminal domain-containing protein [Kofleriaceae bacterium]|nr:GMC family oxidoreductase N-terminal domain-containing protein [Kofleriaceae bacterium]